MEDSYIYDFKLTITNKQFNANTLLNNGYKILNNSLCRSSKLDAEVLLSSVLKKKIEEILSNYNLGNKSKILKLNFHFKNRTPKTILRIS